MYRRARRRTEIFRRSAISGPYALTSSCTSIFFVSSCRFVCGFYQSCRRGVKKAQGILTTNLPRAPPLASVAKASGNSSIPISRTMGDRSRFMSVASRCHMSFRISIGQVTESIPMRLTPRRINGMTVSFRSIPPVRPVLAIPAHAVVDFTSHESRSPPAASTAAAHWPCSIGRSVN